MRCPADRNGSLTCYLVRYFGNPQFQDYMLNKFTGSSLAYSSSSWPLTRILSILIYLGLPENAMRMTQNSQYRICRDLRLQETSIVTVLTLWRRKICLRTPLHAISHERILLQATRPAVSVSEYTHLKRAFTEVLHPRDSV